MTRHSRALFLRAATRWLLVALQVAFVLWPVVYWRGGVIDKEAASFVQGYLDKRGFLSQVFDPSRNDFNNYQARELSYATDWLDARVLRALLERGVVLLVPLSAFVGSLALLLVFPRALRHAFPDVRPVMAALCLLVYLSQFAFLSSAGLFYRSGKMLLVPLLLGFASALVRRARMGEREKAAEKAKDAALVFLLGTTGALFDRQGFFELALACVLVGAAALLGERLLTTLVALAAAVAACVLYNLALAPALIKALNGYRPSFEYQSLSIAAFVAKPQRWVQGADVAASYVTLLLGGAPILVVAVLALALLLAWWRKATGARLRLGVLAAVVGMLAGQWLMLALMIHRHKELYSEPDHRLCYYPLVFQALMALGLGGAVAMAGRHWGRPAELAMNAALALIVAGNVLAWPRRRAEMEPWFPEQVAQSERLKGSLRDGGRDPGLGGAHGRLYEVLSHRRHGQP